MFRTRLAKLLDREPAKMLELSRLLTEMGNAHFDCGQHDGAGDEYAELCVVAYKAKQDVIDFIRKMRGAAP